MSDYADTLNYGNDGGGSIWDPSIGKNVNLVNSSPTEYIRNNPDIYKNYTGAVMGGNIGVGALAPEIAPRTSPTSGNFDPNEYRWSQQRLKLNPYDTNYRSGADAQDVQFGNTVRRIPGANPTYGVLPGGGDQFYNLLSGEELDPNKLNPEQLAFGRFTARHPGNIPTLVQSGGRGGISGRGYHLKSTNSPEEMALSQAVQAGDVGAAERLARIRGTQWRENPLSSMQKFARQYYSPALMALGGGLATGGVGAVYGPAIGALTGAGVGAMTQGMQTNWQNPGAIFAGAAGGAAGGYGAGYLTQGMNPFVQGAASGFGGSVGRDLASGAVTGKINPGQIFRNAAISGAASGAAGGLTGLTRGGYTNTPAEPGGGFATNPTLNPYAVQTISPYVRQGVGGILNTVLPGRPSQPTQEEIARQREKKRSER